MWRCILPVPHSSSPLSSLLLCFQHLLFQLRLLLHARMQARAQELQLETRVIKHLDELLKKCGRGSGASKAISNWLCAEGLEGHAKKGLSRILW